MMDSCCSAASVSAVDEMNTPAEDTEPVVRTTNKRRKKKYCSPIDDDDSSDVLEQSTATAAGRCLRSRDSVASDQAKKWCGSSEVDEDKDDDYEPEAVSKPKRRKRRRR